jgi:hypothetical protein
MNSLETLAKVFCVRLPKSAENRAFSATPRIKSPEHEFFSLPNRHPQIERSRADNVVSICQVNSAGAQSIVDFSTNFRGINDLGLSLRLI